MTSDTSFERSHAPNTMRKERDEAPERIRVCVRAGKEDWIGVAYAAGTSDPSKIHEYVSIDLLATRVQEAREEALKKAAESPILAFEEWLLRYVEDCGKLSQREYGIAYAAFIAAHPGSGPLARVMSAPDAITVVRGVEERGPQCNTWRRDVIDALEAASRGEE